MGTTNVWKLWLKSNSLADNSLIGEISTNAKTLKTEDIARRISKSGCDIKYNTILWVLNQSDTEIINAIAEGKSVQTGLGSFAPAVRGTFANANTTFSEAEGKLRVNYTQSDTVRDMLSETGVEILGVKGARAYISAVQDDYTCAQDGTLSAGRSATVRGRCIKIEGTDPSVGISLTDADGNTTRCSSPLAHNMPSEVRFTLPDSVAKGNYTLSICTQYSGSKSLLKTPRKLDLNVTIV